MKKIFLMIALALAAGMTTSCGGDDPIDPPGPVNPDNPDDPDDPDNPDNPDDPDNPDNPDKEPTWKVDNAQQYGETMSVWVRTEQGGSTDALALFYGGQCRGTATMVLSDSQGQLWCLLVYGTGEEFSDEMLGDILRLRDDCDFAVVFDESLALPGQELVRRGNVDDSTVFIYSPHKAISVNSCKFSAIVCHSQYKEIVDDATDVFGGAMSRSSVGAVHHYLSDNYHEVCVPAYRDFVRRREEDLAAVLAAFPRARVVPNGSGHYRTIITGIRMLDDRYVVEMIARIRERTGFLFYPGTVTGFPREFGLSFRVNLLQDRVNVREGLASVLSALEDER